MMWKAVTMHDASGPREGMGLELGGFSRVHDTTTVGGERADI